LLRAAMMNRRSISTSACRRTAAHCTRRALQRGNIHLRQAIALKKRRGEAALGALITPTELAKQSYRDVLRAEPGDWDARFNLERALRLLPDQDDEASGPTTRTQ